VLYEGCLQAGWLVRWLIIYAVRNCLIDSLPVGRVSDSLKLCPSHVGPGMSIAPALPPTDPTSLGRLTNFRNQINLSFSPYPYPYPHRSNIIVFSAFQSVGIEGRSRTVELWSGVAQYCLLVGNYNSATAILESLESPAIARLKITVSQLSKTMPNNFDFMCAKL